MMNRILEEAKYLFWKAEAFLYLLRSNFWFIPAIMVISAVVMSFAMTSLDTYLIDTERVDMIGWVYSSNPEGARSLLSTVAGSMITVAGVVFSITIVALTLASSQYGPRLMGNFIRDRGNQIVLGTFISTFVYCLLVLGTIKSSEQSAYVPHIAITFAVLLALLSISVLIYFIHHVAVSIQANTIISFVDAELKKSLGNLYPDKIGYGSADESTKWTAPGEAPESFDNESAPVHTKSSGYLRLVDGEGIMNVCISRDLVLKIACRPGEFVVEGEPIVYVWPDKALDKKLEKDIRDSFIFGSRRTTEQDVEFAIDQLVEIAVRSLSPGINDPFTAILCVDRLTVSLCMLAAMPLPSATRYDSEKKLRLVAKRTEFSDLLDAAFNQIRQYGRPSAAVTIRLLESLVVIAERVKREDDRAAVLKHAEMIIRGTSGGLPEELDRRDAEERYRQILEILQ